MLQSTSSLRGYTVEASDGQVGALRDVLFDDRSWKPRWLVVKTGTWLLEREVLLHPSAVTRLDHDLRRLSVNLTKVQVEGSIAVVQDAPVSRRMETKLYEFYNWNPLWGGVSYFNFGGDHDDGDPHLRSIAEVTGYNLHAKDGDIGHVEDFLFDDVGWSLRYLIVDTKNWWPGKHVLLSPYAVADVDWPDRRIELNVTREKVKGGPEWEPAAIADRDHEMRLHHYHGWRGYEW